MLQLDLNGKTALVTGGTGELGRVIVRTLAACGADVAVIYHGAQERAAELVGEIKSLGRRSIAAQADVGNEQSVMTMRDAVVKEFGSVDILITNAVVQIHPWKSVLEQPLADYESQWRSCVMQNVLMARAFLPAMIEANRGGRIIAINTECAMQNFPTYSAYVSGKRGMDGVLRVLAREVGEHGITVNQIAPGWMVSDRHRQEHTERQESYEKNVPLRHRGEDQDVANAVAFLASDLAKFISGQFLAVSGGTVMPGI